MIAPRKKGKRGPVEWGDHAFFLPASDDTEGNILLGTLNRVSRITLEVFSFDLETKRNGRTRFPPGRVFAQSYNPCPADSPFRAQGLDHLGRIVQEQPSGRSCAGALRSG